LEKGPIFWGVHYINAHIYDHDAKFHHDWATDLVRRYSGKKKERKKTSAVKHKTAWLATLLGGLIRGKK